MILGERFWSKVNKTDTCWLWIAGRSAAGYGMFSGPGRTMRLAHRLAYEAANGPIPNGLCLDHICHVPACINPAHLQAVTVRENIENRAGAQRNSKSGVRGVIPAGPRWRVVVFSRGKQYWGGTFDDLAEADAAAKALRLRLMTNSLADGGV